MNRHSNTRRQSLMVAFCGMAAGLSVVIMLLGGVIPAATYAVPMLCGLILLPVLLEFGPKAAWTVYIAVSLLALMLGFDKEAAFFYIFMGYYPIVKWKIERVPAKWKKLLIKIVLFSVSMGLMYGLLALLFPMAAFMQEFQEMGLWMSVAFAVMYLFCMLAYDRLLLPLSMIYVNRIRPRLTFLK